MELLYRMRTWHREVGVYPEETPPLALAGGGVIMRRAIYVSIRT